MTASKDSHSIAYGLAPAARTASANGTGVDLSGFGSNMFVVEFGVVTDGTHTPKLQESSDNSSWADVAASDLSGSFSAATSSSGGSATQKVSYIGALRYVRPVITVAGATTGAVSAAVAVLGRGRKQP